MTSRQYAKPGPLTAAIKRELRLAGVDARKVNTSQARDAWSTFIFTDQVAAAAAALEAAFPESQVRAYDTGFVGMGTPLPA